MDLILPRIRMKSFLVRKSTPDVRVVEVLGLRLRREIYASDPAQLSNSVYSGRRRFHCFGARGENSDYKLTATGERLDYFFELISALESADERTSFDIRTYIGNRSLFLSGVFPEWIRRRSETRGFPNLHYYETLGEANYRTACDHQLAKRYAVAPILATLADRFQATRIALNDLAHRLFSLDALDFPVELFLPSG